MCDSQLGTERIPIAQASENMDSVAQRGPPKNIYIFLVYSIHKNTMNDNPRNLICAVSFWRTAKFLENLHI